MKSYFAVIAGMAMGLAASFPAAAVEVSGLYEAEVPVTGQDAAERAAASRTALEEVLVKVSGSADILQSPAIKPLVAQAEQWVQSYQYRAAPPAPATAAAPAAPAQLLWVAFDHQAINRHLSEAALPVWGLNRPRILLWLAVQEGSGRSLVGGDSRPDLQEAISTQARRRGLPVSVPLLDLQDQGGLTVADLWGDFADAVSKASERYQPDAVLVGRVFAVAAGKWQSHWTVYHRGIITSWDSAEGMQNEAVAAGIDGTAEQLAKRYALSLTPDAVSTVVVTVENVATLADYANVLRYLQSLDPVAGVQVARVEGAKVSYLLKVRGQPQALIRTLGWGKMLRPSDQGAAASSAPPAEAGKAAESPASEEYRYRIVP